MNSFTSQHILGILVLYKCTLEESKTFKSLVKSFKEKSYFLNLLVYDNSPSKSFNVTHHRNLNINIFYIHDKNNSGLSSAYNYGLKLANTKGIPWILLLDQDTELPINYIDIFLNTLNRNFSHRIVCAFPYVFTYDKKMISPSKIFCGGIIRPYKKIKNGEIYGRVSGINSGTFLSVNYITEIGGFCSDYPLDMLDHWYFNMIFRMKRGVYLLDAKIFHNLSINSFAQEVSPNRYTSILKGENLLFSHNLCNRLVYKLRLVIRLYKLLRYEDKSYFRLTVNSILNKL